MKINIFHYLCIYLLSYTTSSFANETVTSNFSNISSSSMKLQDHKFKEFIAARQVYVYRAYKDLQVFHFTLPPHLSKAVFNLTSNSTGGCSSRNITVYLQADSFPLVSPDGAEFPEKTWTSRQSLYHSTLLSNLEPVLLIVNAPRPGDWFMVGFIFDDSNRITQAGLFPSCYAWLQVDASYYQEVNIEILNTHVIVNETSFLPYTISDLTYFSFFVPSQVWTVDVIIKNCQLMNYSSLLSDNSLNASCPLFEQLRPSALPFNYATNVVEQNCSTLSDDSCVLSFTPKEDAWHYLALIPTENIVSFEIGIAMKICDTHNSVVAEKMYYKPTFDNEILFHDLKFFKKLNNSQGDNLDAPDLMVNDEDEEAKVSEIMNPSIQQVNLTDFNVTDVNETFLLMNSSLMDPPALNLTIVSMNELHSLFLNSSCCWPRYELMRKTFPGNFVYEFDLKPDSNGTVPLMMNLSNYMPTVLSYDLQPIIDIGGTLMVDIAVSPFLNTTSHNYSVHACLNFGIRSAFAVDINGSLECDSGYHLLVHSAGSYSYSGSILVPYPEPGRWFLTLFPACFLTNESETVVCTSDVTTIIFSISSSSCIMGKCGEYGTCYQMIAGGFLYSTCVCDAGYRGYACTDDLEATPNWKLLLSTLLLCLSNLFFLPAIILALYRRYLTEALIYTFAMFFSTFYHACDQELYSICLMRLTVLQFCDFYTAILSFWVTLIVMANLPPTLISLLHMAGAVIVALGVENDRTGLWVFAIPSISAFLVMIFAWIWHSKKNNACYPPKNYWIKCLLPGVVLAAVGLICYAFLETEDNYYVIHSFWHAIMALSILCLLPPRRTKKGHLFDMMIDSTDDQDEDAHASDSQALTINLSL